jgi:hypothetical protein
VIKKLEVLANVAVIVTSVVVCTVLVRRYLLMPTNQAAIVKAAPVSTNDSSSPKRSIEPGTKISLAGVDWSKSSRTLLLALSTTCHFCTESAPFYQKLQQQKRQDVRLLALLPQPLQESRSYLDKLGVKVDELTQSPLSSVSASGTPTLMLIDNQGTVIDSWVGKLPDDAAEKVTAQIRR